MAKVEFFFNNGTRTSGDHMTKKKKKKNLDTDLLSFIEINSK